MPCHVYSTAKETVHFCNENYGKSSEYSTKMRQISKRQDIRLSNAKKCINPNSCKQENKSYARIRDFNETEHLFGNAIAQINVFTIQVVSVDQ